MWRVCRHGPSDRPFTGDREQIGSGPSGLEFGDVLVLVVQGLLVSSELSGFDANGIEAHSGVFLLTRRLHHDHLRFSHACGVEQRFRSVVSSDICGPRMRQCCSDTGS